jgi:DNA-binding ferritin-like protein (Dps family)
MITVTEWEKIGDSEHSYSATAETRNAAIKTLEALRDRDAELVNEVLGDDVATVEMKQFTREDVEEFVDGLVTSDEEWINFNYDDSIGSKIDISADDESPEENVSNIRATITDRFCDFLGIKEAE